MAENKQILESNLLCGFVSYGVSEDFIISPDNLRQCMVNRGYDSIVNIPKIKPTDAFQKACSRCANKSFYANFVSGGENHQRKYTFVPKGVSTPSEYETVVGIAYVVSGGTRQLSVGQIATVTHNTLANTVHIEYHSVPDEHLLDIGAIRAQIDGIHENYEKYCLYHDNQAMHRLFRKCATTMRHFQMGRKGVYVFPATERDDMHNLVRFFEDIRDESTDGRSEIYVYELTQSETNNRSLLSDLETNIVPDIDSILESINEARLVGEKIPTAKITQMRKIFDGHKLVVKDIFSLVQRESSILIQKMKDAEALLSELDAERKVR